MITDKRYTATDLMLVCNNATPGILHATNTLASSHGLLKLLETLQDIAELAAEHEKVREQLELDPTDPLPEYRIEHGNVYDMSLAIQRSINRIK